MEIESGEEELMARVIAIGEQNFRTIRENNYFYVDKTEFIADWWLKTGATATLITRPRRFGKTLMMDTVREFFTAEDGGDDSRHQPHVVRDQRSKLLGRPQGYFENHC